VAGKSLAQIAADRGIKIGTVRAHTKTVFSKTQTRGQAELAGALTRLAFFVPRIEDHVGPTPAATSHLVGGRNRREATDRRPNPQANER